MSIEEITVETLDEAVSHLERLALSNGEFIFRGHKQSGYRICSTLARYGTTPHESWNPGPDEMLTHFLTNVRSIGELPAGIAGDRRARLEYGRHYGVPSPLIDFTLSPYVALFFAFDGVRLERNKPNDTVSIYALDVSALGFSWARYHTPLNIDIGKTTEEYHLFMHEREPLFVHGYPREVLKYVRFPASWNKRMQQQLGVFIYDTLDYAHLDKTDFEDFVGGLKEADDASSITVPMLTKINIPKSVAGDVFRRLELMGINATRLYDDASGAAADVYNSYYYNRKTGYAWDLEVPPPDETKM